MNVYMYVRMNVYTCVYEDVCVCVREDSSELPQVYIVAFVKHLARALVQQARLQKL